MRIFPLALIGVGTYALLHRYGFINHELLHLFWPVLLIVIGLAMLARGPRWRADMRGRMRQWHFHRDGAGPGCGPRDAGASDPQHPSRATPPSASNSPSHGEPR